MNVERAMKIGYQLLRRGHSPYIPQLTHYWHLFIQSQAINVPRDRWMELDLAWLRVSEAMFFLGPSPGANVELNHARLLGLTIYLSLEEIPVKGLVAEFKEREDKC